MLPVPAVKSNEWDSCSNKRPAGGSPRHDLRELPPACAGPNSSPTRPSLLCYAQTWRGSSRLRLHSRDQTKLRPRLFIESDDPEPGADMLRTVGQAGYDPERPVGQPKRIAIFCCLEHAVQRRAPKHSGDLELLDHEPRVGVERPARHHIGAINTRETVRLTA